MIDAVSRLREYAGDGTALGDDVAEVLAELDAARAEVAKVRVSAVAALTQGAEILDRAGFEHNAHHLRKLAALDAVSGPVPHPDPIDHRES